MSLYIILAVSCVILTVILPKSKTIAIFQLVLIWIIMGLNNGGMDYEGNLAIYNEVGNNNFSGLSSGWLYNVLCHYSKAYRFDYVTFNAIIFGIMLIFIALVIFAETDRPCIFLDFFILYPMVESVIQKRFFFGMVIIFLGLHFLERNKKVIYFLFVLLAIGFHFSFIIFIPFILIDKLDDKKFWKFIIFIYCGIYFVIKYGSTFLSGFKISSKLDAYIYDTNYSSALIGVLFATAFFVQILLLNYAINKTEFKNMDKVGFLKKINILMLVLVPMCFFESVYLRYYRVVLLESYIVFTSENSCFYFRDNKLHINKKMTYMFVYIVYTVVLELVIYMNSSFGLRGYIDTILTNRLF